MREQGNQHLDYPGVYTAAQDHWEALAGPSGLQEEFASNYLGSWFSKKEFEVELARDFGRPDSAGPEIAQRLLGAQELVLVADGHGVHVYLRPEHDQRSRVVEAAERVRHLRLIESSLPDSPDQAGRAL